MNPPANKKSFEKEDAFSYMDKVKYKFMNQPYVYEAFLKLMKDFKKKKIDTPGVIAHVSHLFRDHPDLMVGFNVFLPPGYEIKVESNQVVSLYS